MRYVGVKFTSGGRIGHRFKDQTTARIISQLYGLKYVHTPYPDHDIEWNKFLGFDEDEITLDDVSDKNHIEIRTTAWVGMPLNNIKAILDNHPEDETVFVFSESARVMLEQIEKPDYDEVARLLRRKYINKRKTFPVVNYFSKDKINVAFHIRRGSDIDPKSETATAPWRYTQLSYYKNVIEKLTKVLGGTAEFHVYSQGTEEEFSSLVDRGAKLHLVPFPPRNYYSLFQSFDHMIRADIFVTAVSAFSYFVSWMNPNVIINLPVKQVVKLPPDESRVLLSNPDGSFDEKKLLQELQ